MISVNEAKRLIKRTLLANIVSDKPNLALTPLVSGKHGIGKSAMIKSIAEDLGGVCITIEGGTLKEGEITGLPYQYKDDNGATKFRFLPYYAVERIQNEEKRIFESLGGVISDSSALVGDENRYAKNDLTIEERIDEHSSHSQRERLSIPLVGIVCRCYEPKHTKQRVRYKRNGPSAARPFLKNQGWR